MSHEPESRSGWESVKDDCEGQGAPQQRGVDEGGQTIQNLLPWETRDESRDKREQGQVRMETWKIRL